MAPKNILDALTGNDDDNEKGTGQDAATEAQAVDEGDPTRTVTTDEGTTTSE